MEVKTFFYRTVVISVVVLVLLVLSRTVLYSQGSRADKCQKFECCQLFPTSLEYGSYCLSGTNDEIAEFLRSYQHPDSLDLLLICPTEDTVRIDTNISRFVNLIGLVIQSPKKHVLLPSSILCLPGLLDLQVEAGSGSVEFQDNVHCGMNQHLKVHFNPLSFSARVVISNRR
jgi:hypothetical protein